MSNYKEADQKMEIYFDRTDDNFNKDGHRESDIIVRRIASLYPEAVWHRTGEDLWKIVVK